MKEKRRLRRITTSETKQIAFYSDSKNQSILRCGVCSDESKMFSPEIIAEISNLSQRENYRLIEAGKVHFAETLENRVLVCIRSVRVDLLKNKK